MDTDVETQEPNGDRSQNDPQPEVDFAACHSSNLVDSDPEQISHINCLQTELTFMSRFELVGLNMLKSFNSISKFFLIFSLLVSPIFIFPWRETY